MTNDRDAYSPNDFPDGSDSAMIQAAVDAAEAEGLGKVVIPRFNRRGARAVWNIDRTILLPSDFTLILDDCHLRMADGAMCRMFQNRNTDTETGNTRAGIQRNIRIIGLGNPILDGGEPNGLDERTSQKDGRPHCSQNLTVYFHGVENFTIENLTVTDQRWWGLMFMFCEQGRIENIRFRLTRHALDTHAAWRNQDGLDFRIGCHHITVRGISGEVGDDMIALTALNDEELEQKGTIAGADCDIHDILLEDVRGVSNMCAIVRLLNHYRFKIYNITMRDIFEPGRPGQENKAQTAIRIGDNRYFRKPSDRVRHGEIFNLHIENLYTRALTAIFTVVTVKNLTARNIHLLEDGQNVWCCGEFHRNTPGFIFVPERQAEVAKSILVPTANPCSTIAENVLIENVYYTARSPAPVKLFRFLETEFRNVSIRNVCNDSPYEQFEYSGNCSGEIKGEAE